MKKIILLTALMFSSSIFASALTWYDIDLYERYTLNQDLVFENGVTFKAGSEFDVIDFMAADTPVAYFQMHFTKCKNVNETADLTLVNVDQEGTRPDVIIGAELEEGCNLGVFVETQEFFTKSIFK